MPFACVRRTRDDRIGMTGSRRLAVVLLLVFVAVVAPAAAGTKGQLPAPAAVDCGASGVAGIGFTAYSCASGAGGTKYAHQQELLVVRNNGTYKGYGTAFSQQDRIARSNNGEVIAAHNGSIVRVTASALKVLINERRLDRLFPGSPGLVAINALTATPSGEVVFRANYWARHKHGCGNVRAELTTAGQVKLFWRTGTGLTCG